MVALITAAAPPKEAFGTIKGRLVWGGKEAPKPVSIKTDKDPAVCAATQHYDAKLVVDPKTRGVADAIVYVLSPKGKNPEAIKALMAADPKPVIDQKACEFIPHSLAIFKDQQIVFKSSDPIGHNIHYTGFTNGSKNQMLTAKGEMVAPKLVAEKRPLELKCDIHPWMSGNIMVFDHPFFAVTAPDGTFEIKGVPAGTQNVVVWHSTTGYIPAGAGKGQPVSVAADQTADMGEVVMDPAKVKK
jgi:hypothetical protein